MNHELKIWPQYFHRVKDGTKTFEIRDNDRGFQMGDSVTLREWDPTVESKREVQQLMMISSQKTRYEMGDYTGLYLEFKIGYVLPIDERRVVFSLVKVSNEKS